MLTPTGAARTDERASWSENAATGRRDENPMSRRPVLPGGTDLGAINWRADECHTHAIDTTAALYRNRRTDGQVGQEMPQPGGTDGRTVKPYHDRRCSGNRMGRAAKHSSECRARTKILKEYGYATAEASKTKFTSDGVFN